ncbi:MAG: hypothetical protein U0414_27535 [Polyangiaceae bacterium]
MRYPPILTGLITAATLSACQPAPAPVEEPPEAFVDQTLSETDVDVLVDSDELPVAGAIVLIRSAAQVGPSSGPVLFTAITDESGHAVGLFTRLTG